MPSAQFWRELRHVRWNEICDEPGVNAVNFQWVSVMALIVMRMPCSETEVERTFSRMKQIFGKRSKRTKRDLLEARLTLQMNGPKMSPDLRSALRKLEGEDDARPPKMQVPPPVQASPELPELPLPILRPREDADIPGHFSASSVGRTVHQQNGPNARMSRPAIPASAGQPED
jgi:hypothetical protein